MGEDNVVHDKKTNNKRFFILSLIPVLILNLIFNDLFMNMYRELIRYFQNGFQPQVLKFFLEEFAWWFGISGGVFLASFSLLKALESQVEKDKKDFNQRKIQSEKITEDYNQTHVVSDQLSVDEENKKLALHDKYGLVEKVYNYSDIVDFELLEDGESVAKGGIGRALVGGALFGGAGAVVGSVTRKNKEYCNSIRVKITIDNLSDPVVYLNFINHRVKVTSDQYKNAHEQAQKIMSTLQLICDKDNNIAVETT